MPPVGFEPTVSSDERPQTYAFERAAIGTEAITKLDGRNEIRSRQQLPAKSRRVTKH